MSGMLGKYLADQFHHPTGLFGGLILPRLLNHRNASMNAFTLDRLDLEPEDRVLELGCGGGGLLLQMASVISKGSVVGVDQSPAMVAFCRKRYGRLVRTGKLNVMCAHTDALPFAQGAFSKVCSVNLIFYLDDVRRAMQETRRILEPGGRLAVCFTSKQYLQDRFFSGHGLNLYEASEVQALVESAGFRDVRMIHGDDGRKTFYCAVGRRP